MKLHIIKPRQRPNGLVVCYCGNVDTIRTGCWAGRMTIRGLENYNVRAVTRGVAHKIPRALRCGRCWPLWRRDRSVGRQVRQRRSA